MRFVKAISIIWGLCLLVLNGWQATVPRDEPVLAWIVFASDRDGNRELYRMRLDGSQQQNLSQSPGYNCCPAFAQANFPYRPFPLFLAAFAMIGWPCCISRIAARIENKKRIGL